MENNSSKAGALWLPTLVSMVMSPSTWAVWCWWHSFHGVVASVWWINSLCQQWSAIFSALWPHNMHPCFIGFIKPFLNLCAPTFKWTQLNGQLITHHLCLWLKCTGLLEGSFKATQALDNASSVCMCLCRGRCYGEVLLKIRFFSGYIYSLQ